MHPYVQSSTIHNSQDMEKNLNICQQMDKEDVVLMEYHFCLVAKLCPTLL